MELQERAEGLLTQAKSILDTEIDTAVRTEAHHFFDLTNDFSVGLREIVDSKEAFAGVIPLNVSALYIYKKPDPVTGEHSCSPSMFFDIASFVDGKFRASNQGGVSHDELVDGVSEDSPMHELLSMALRAAEGDGLEHGLHTAYAEKIADFFRQLLAGGGMVRKESKWQTLSDGSWFKIDTAQISGDLPLIEKRNASSNPVVGVARSIQPIQYQLEKTSQGNTETYVRPSDEAEYRAAYAESVHRDDDGTIISLTVSFKDMDALIEAERAAGLRKLRPEILDKIEEGLGMWAVGPVEL